MRVFCIFAKREQLEEFLGIFSPRLSVPLLKFVGQMLFGIQAAKSVLLTRIGHELREETTPKKTEEQLCRNLGTATLGDRIHASVMKEVARQVKTRWRVEEMIRFVKQSYHVEEVRNLMFARVRNVAALVLAVTYFVAVRLGLYEKCTILRQHITNVARRIFGTPDRTPSGADFPALGGPVRVWTSDSAARFLRTLPRSFAYKIRHNCKNAGGGGINSI